MKTQKTTRNLLVIRLLRGVPLVLILVLSSCGKSNNSVMVPSEVAPPPPPPPVPDARASDSVYTEVDIYPTFPGGDAALRNFLSENTEYPDASKKKGTQGKVIVQFVVDAAGNVGRVKILRGVDPLIDEEAMRAVQKLPKFEPGLKEGKPVSVYYMVPLIFKLTK